MKKMRSLVLSVLVIPSALLSSDPVFEDKFAEMSLAAPDCFCNYLGSCYIVLGINRSEASRNNCVSKTTASSTSFKHEWMYS